MGMKDSANTVEDVQLVCAGVYDETANAVRPNGHFPPAALSFQFFSEP
jgi:hypothetical protein